MAAFDFHFNLDSVSPYDRKEVKEELSFDAAKSLPIIAHSQPVKTAFLD